MARYAPFIVCKSILTALCCWLACCAFSQSAKDIELNVVKHMFMDSTNVIELYLKATEDGRNLPIENEKEDFIIYDIYENEAPQDLNVYNITEEYSFTDEDTTSQEKFYLLFLVGLDRKETPSFKAARSSLLQAFADKIQLPAETEFYLSTYGDTVYMPKLVKLRDVKEKLDKYPDNQEYAELHQALVESARFLRQKGKGRKVILLLTDGFDNPDTASYTPLNKLPYDQEDISKILARMNDNFMVFPLGMGEQLDTSFFRLIVQATANPSDTLSTDHQIPTDLKGLLFSQRSYLFNKVIRVEPNPSHPIYKGEQRSLQVHWHGQSINYDMSNIGTPANPVLDLLPKDYMSKLSWLNSFLVGLAIVISSLFLMWWLIPWNKRRIFNQTYIVPYNEQAGVRKRDPLSGEVFQDGEMVVVKCPRTTTSVATWEYVGNKCPQYPRCLNFDPPCEGHGAPIAEDSFFSMKGAFRRLNWLWFGLVGGLIAWTILAFIHVFFYEDYYAMVTDFFGSHRELTNDLMIGMALGIGISAALSFVEEKSQPRRFSWLRVLVRIVAGTLASMLVFLVGFYLQYQGYVPNYYVAGLITWLLFGVAIGVVMSVESSITTLRGIMGGVLAAVVGYTLYLFFLNNIFENNFPLAKLLSLLTLGGILGGILVTVVFSLEDFELEYLSPEAFRQTKPISKWLKQSLDVFIGTEEGSYVYVKWTDDAVHPRHARLHFGKGVVFLEPYAETLVNGRILPVQKSTPLKDGDVIQLGRESETRMRFREKRKVQPTRPAYADKLAGQVEGNNGEGKKGKIIIKGKG